MFVLSYFRQDYDDVEKNIIAISSSKEKLENKKKELIGKYDEYKKEFERIVKLQRKEWDDYYIKALQYWMDNKQAIMNPESPDGLWTHNVIPKKPAFYLRPSGCPIEVLINPEVAAITKVLSEKEKNKRLEALIITLAQLTFGEVPTYVNKEKLIGPRPIWTGHTENYPKIPENAYDGDCLIIEEVEEL